MHALSLVNDEEFAALVAHEIGHEFVWSEYEAAGRQRDRARIRELELRCDGIAVLTLRRLGIDPERLVRAVEMLTWYNEQRRLDPDRQDYVSRDDRREFIRSVAKLQWADELSKPDGSEPACSYAQFFALHRGERVSQMEDRHPARLDRPKQLARIDAFARQNEGVIDSARDGTGDSSLVT